MTNPDGMGRIRTERGMMARLAVHLGLSRGAVAMWKQVPAARVRAVSRFTGIPLHQLRPDLYEAPDPDAVEVANDEARRRGEVGTHAPVRHGRLREAA